MRHQALLPITFLLLLLLGCTGPSINALECVERSWFCPQCKAFIPKGCICKSCGGKFALTRQFLDKEKAALIAHLESIQEQVSKDDWADFLTQCQRRNWICKQCRWYNQQFDYCCDTCKTRRQEHQNNQEQQALVACLTQLLERLRSVGIAHSSSFQRQNGWVCSRCQCFNVADRCKKCLIEKYNPDPGWLAQEQDAFIAYIDNVVSRFKEDQPVKDTASDAQKRLNNSLAQTALFNPKTDCGICFDPLEEHATYNCPHCKTKKFHKKCVIKFIETATEIPIICPYCKQPWNRNEIPFQ